MEFSSISAPSTRLCPASNPPKGHSQQRGRAFSPCLARDMARKAARLPENRRWVCPMQSAHWDRDRRCPIIVLDLLSARPIIGVVSSCQVRGLLLYSSSKRKYHFVLNEGRHSRLRLSGTQHHPQPKPEPEPTLALFLWRGMSFTAWDVHWRLKKTMCKADTF